VDLWSLGAVVGEMLTKQPVFKVSKTANMLCIRIRSERQHFPGSAAEPRAFQAVGFNILPKILKIATPMRLTRKLKYLMYTGTAVNKTQNFSFDFLTCAEFVVGSRIGIKMESRIRFVLASKRC
jgi:hypothetical protein